MKITVLRSYMSRMREAMSAFALAALLLLNGCSQFNAPASAGSDATPKNIIILFGDGAASTQWELGRYTSRALREKSFVITDVIFKQGALGLLATYSANSPVTDSAAAASAMSTGFKTNNGMISVLPDGKPVQNIMEAAKARGKRIGLVSTAAIHDASPAAFGAHAKIRTEAQSIVDQYLTLEPDVLMGGGRDYFLPKGKPGGKRSDGKDVMAAFAAKGYEVVQEPGGLRNVGGSRLLALFADEDMDFELDRNAKQEPSTADMAAAALRVLSTNNPNGFVLFLENESIDTAGHRNDAAALIRDLWALDDAVQVALDFQQRNPDTLIIVTGDHETGGLSFTYAQKDMSSLESRNRFYPARSHLEMVSRIKASLERAVEQLGKKPSREALDRVVAENFPGLKLDDDLRAAILNQQTLERNMTYTPQAILGRMISRQSGFYWGTTGHTTEPAVVGALGPGASMFRGYMDNTDFAKTLRKLIEGR